MYIRLALQNGRLIQRAKGTKRSDTLSLKVRRKKQKKRIYTELIIMILGLLFKRIVDNLMIARFS